MELKAGPKSARGWCGENDEVGVLLLLPGVVVVVVVVKSSRRRRSSVGYAAASL